MRVLLDDWTTLREENSAMTMENKVFTRRDFLAATTAASAGLAMAQAARAQTAAPAPAAAPNVITPSGAVKELNIAIIGCGAQGSVLMDSIVPDRIPGIKFRAVCDIWAKKNLRIGERRLLKLGHTVKPYEDYHQMIAEEKGLDGVLIATPDFMHAPQTIACLKAGLNVYCEKMMSNSLEAAQNMIKAARETKKILQIGHQRRSNPRYQHAREKVMKSGMLNRVMHANAQWNRGKKEDLTTSETYTIDPAVLEKNGYKNMQEFLNWRWYAKYGGGPISDLGAHQLDILAWFFGTNPKAITAAGGVDFYKQSEMYDNVMAVLDFELPEGTSRAFYQVLTTTGSGGYFERFMGVHGTLELSENPKYNTVYREPYAPTWDEYMAQGLVLKEAKPEEPAKAADAQPATDQDARVSPPPDAYKLPVVLEKKPHQPHLENFFDAIRNGTPVNCPPEEAYKTVVIVDRIKTAVKEGRRVELKPEDFVV
jgi:predicted dehydrogenase